MKIVCKVQNFALQHDSVTHNDNISYYILTTNSVTYVNNFYYQLF